jgi:DNA-binding transcriptional ArsR family regulator
MGLFHPNADELQMADVLHALSDPQRLCIVRSLAADPTPRRCGSFDLDITKSTLTHHFRVLREEGTARLNSLRRKDLDERFPGLLDAVLAGAPDSVKVAAVSA